MPINPNAVSGPKKTGVTLGISPDGSLFTLNNLPTFLLGMSYYGAQSISSDDFRTQDLDDMVRDGFNWIRVWAFWLYDKQDVSVMSPTGTVRNPYMDRLKSLIVACNERNIIVDVSMTRGDHPFPENQTEHLACAQTLANALKEFRNVYIDVANERDIQNARYVSMSDVGGLIMTIKRIDPDRLCTASGNPTSAADILEHVKVGRCDFICPHLLRDQGSAIQTIGKVRDFVTWMQQKNMRVPVHLQEPFRRGYTAYNPVKDDFIRDCTGAKIATAAGWCFHNGSDKISRDGRPCRCFLMTDAEGRLYSQLDTTEQAVCAELHAKLAGTDPSVVRFHAKYFEQLAHQIGRPADEGWVAQVAQDPAGFLNYGPYLNTLPAGAHRLVWRMKIDAITGSNDDVLKLDVNASGTILADKSIARRDFASADTWQEFSLDFRSTGDQQGLEFRSFWTGKADITLSSITLFINKGILENQAPSVEAGPNQVIIWPANTVTLNGIVRDDGLPDATEEVSIRWTKQQGSGSVTFGNAAAARTTATFSQAGRYVLRLTADDGALTNYADVTITVAKPGTERLIKTYKGGPDFLHQSGALMGDAWRGDVARRFSFLAFGPYDNSLPAGALIARFSLQIDNHTQDDGYVCILEVHDATAGRILTNAALTRKDWTQAKTFQTFDLQFAHTAGHTLEFRTYYMEVALLDLKKVEIWAV